MRLLLALCLTLLTALPARAEDRLRVVTTFTILQDMARNVAGDHADVVSLTKPGADIHNYEPTPRDMLRAQRADLVLRNGLNLEAWFEQFLSNLRDVDSVTVSDGVVPISISGGDYDGRPNPHGWMGLDSAMIYVDNIRDALAARDPAHAADYAANADAYKARIRAVVAPLRDRIRTLPENRRWLATSEGAFSYLARDYGLRETYLWPVNADQQGRPQQIRRMIDTVVANHIPAVFSESTVSPKPARQIARETGAAYGGVLYVDSLSAADGPVPTYLDLLARTSETILKGLE